MKVSIIITCFNLEKYISRAINSCLNQTMHEDEFEIIVVDDGSQDNSWNIIKSYGKIIRAIKIEKNSGVALASNKGILISKGENIVRVDGDDFVNRNFIFTLYEVLRWNKDLGFVYCDNIIVNDKEERIQSKKTLEVLLDHGAGVMFRKNLMYEIGLYDESLRNREDYDFVLRFLKKYKGFHLQLPYYRYFKREGSLSSYSKERSEMKSLINDKLDFKL